MVFFWSWSYGRATKTAIEKNKGYARRKSQQVHIGSGSQFISTQEWRKREREREREREQEQEEKMKRVQV